MKQIVFAIGMLFSMPLAAQSWVVNGINRPITSGTSFFPELGLLQAESPTQGTLYITRANTTPFGLFQIGGSPIPTFVPGYIKIDQGYYLATGTMTITNGLVSLSTVQMSNCRRESGAAFPSGGQGIFRYGPQNLTLPLGGWHRLFFYNEATVYAMTTLTGDVVCDQAVTPTLTPIVEAVLYKNGFEL